MPDIMKHITPHTMATMIVMDPSNAWGFSLNLKALVTIVTFVVTFYIMMGGGIVMLTHT